MTVQQLLERFEDAVAAAEQREVELRAIRAELQEISHELAGVRRALEQMADAGR